MEMHEKTDTINALNAIIQEQQNLIEEKRSEIFQLKSVIEKLPGSVYWKDKKGVYLGCNEFVLKMAGAKYDREIIGKTDFNMPWKERAYELQAIDQKVLNTHLPIEAEEAPILANGQQIVMLTNKAPLRDENGEVMGIIGISVDITDRKQMEVVLEEAKTKAEVANEAKTVFLENMRHDIRTPLTGIIGCADLLKEESNSPKIKEYFDDLVASSHALLNLLNEVLEASKLNAGEIPLLKRKFDLKARLEEVVNLNKAKAGEKGLVLSFAYDDPISHYVIGDSTRIHRIALELVTNALNFTEAGEVKLSVQLAKRNENNLVIKLIVEDTGMGIPAEKQQEIFVQFKRLTPSYEGIYKGTGLGLSVVKQFMDEIQGEIYVESEPHKGSKFICLIPLREALLDDEFGSENMSANKMKLLSPLENSSVIPLKINKKAAQKDSPEASGLSQKQSVILVVEDQPVAANVVKNTLSALNCEVDIAVDGKTALELIEKNYYDLILMDIGLPDMNGYEVTRRIRSNSVRSIAHIPIVALTAHADSDNKQNSLDASINAVITKPLTKQQAKNILATFISQRKKLAENREEPTEKIVDFEYAKALLGGNEAVVWDMLKMLVDSLPVEIENLEIAYQEQAWKNLQSIAHKLQGGSSYCGTLRLKSVCSELESYIESGLTSRIPALYQKLLVEIDALEKFIKNESHGFN